MIIFSIEFILTNIIFSVIICAALMRFNERSTHSNLELLLYSLGMGPVFTSLLLYYLLLFLPHLSNLFYLLAILITYFILLFLGRKSFYILWTDIIARIKNTRKKFNNLNTSHRLETVIFTGILILFLISFLFLYLTNTLQTPLDETDSLRYGTLGKILFTEKSLEYRWVRIYPQTGSYSKINHAPSFSLLLTWEKIMNSFFNSEKDLYYKSTSVYYGILILSLMIFWLSKKSKYLALLSIFALLSGFIFYRTLIKVHLDSYRIFFLIISWIFLAYAIEKKDSLSYLLFGVSSGFAAFSHTIGAVLILFNYLALFIFMKGNLKIRLSRTCLVTILVIIFGWFHYILDIIWGFGWIIFNRDITWWG